jgi:HEPN domain
MDDQVPEPEADEVMAGNLMAQVFDLWILPELQRRNSALSRNDVLKAVIEMHPGDEPVILLNEEAQIVVAALSKRQIDAGEEVGIEDVDFEAISSLWPGQIDPNSGWICFLRVAGKEYVAFDFRYNRETASKLLDKAEQFLLTARSASTSVALDLLHSAAELTVQAQMLSQSQTGRRHDVRRKWLRDWANLGNAPKEYSHVIDNLADLRRTARYGDIDPRVSHKRMQRIIEVVESMIDESRKGVGFLG